MDGSKATVEVLDRLPLHCADSNALQSIESPWRLGPFDQAVPLLVPTAVVFVYRQEQPVASDTNELIPLGRLHQSLSRVLDYYPHLTGRIAVNPVDSTPEIDRLGTGAELLSARCDAALDLFYTSDPTPRLIVTNLPDGGNALLAPFDATMHGVCNNPILTVQCTRFACGSVALGIRLLHVVCDADGFFQFVSDLAELYRHQMQSPNGTACLYHPPHIRSYMADLHNMQQEERNAALEFKPWVYELSPIATAASAEVMPNVVATPPPPPPPAVIGRVLRFSVGELDALKAEASKEQKMSTFVALSAHLWQCLSRARLVVSNKQVESCDILISVNWRGPDRMNMPERYFPNCVFCPFFSLPTEHLVSAPLSSIAAAVNKSVRSLSRQEAVQTLHWFAAQPDKSRVKLGFSLEKDMFLVSQWNRFDMYRGAEFETVPVLVSLPFSPITLLDGLVYFLPTKETQGAAMDIDVSLAISQPVWDVLDQDANFRRYCNKQ